jgi:hypothetical protein
MSRSESTRVQDAGREGPRATWPVSGPSPQEPQLVSGSPGDLMAPEKSTRAWEAAYRQYGRAWEWTARCGKDDPAAAREMAAASWAVAAAWRQIASATTLPWWALAAISSAAGAFESQARDYENRNTSEGS